MRGRLEAAARQARTPVSPRPLALVPALVLGVVVGSLAACSEGADPPSPLGPGERLPGGMTLTSPAFRTGAPVPERYSCEGLNVPPPLRWSRAPAGTTELALVVEDPEAPDGVFVHWVVVGIDPATRALEPGTAPPGARVLAGSSDNAVYIGPCPPDGDGEHHYWFQVYALRSPPPLREGSGPLEAVRAVRRAAVASGVLVGTFTR